MTCHECTTPMTFVLGYARTWDSPEEPSGYDCPECGCFVRSQEHGRTCPCPDCQDAMADPHYH